MNKYILLLLFSLSILTAVNSSAQATSSKTDSLIIGTWKGTSLCQVPNSPCHDETVVYHISKIPGNDTFYIQADKIVNGSPEDMGIVPCLFDEKNNLLTSTAYHSSWKFTLKNEVLDGTLFSRGALYRKIRVTKIH